MTRPSKTAPEQDSSLRQRSPKAELVDESDSPQLSYTKCTKSKATRPTVSIAKIFKTSKPAHRNRKRRREPSPAATVINELGEEFDKIGDRLTRTAENTFDAAWRSHVKSLKSIKQRDQEFVTMVSRNLSALSVPLLARPVALEPRDSEASSQEHLGACLQRFGEILAREKANLEKYWAEWDKLQIEYLRLGIDVFGPRPFGEQEAPSHDGFHNTMTLWNLELRTKVAEFGVSLEEAGCEALRKMKHSEAELDAATKKEKTRLLASLLGEL
ncbi:unnamed protein product [Blumeria hordei]|uniref:Uncharacterized protein n=1 Tax=Blumeria hordei TaxID=2867405 RepID=A0A383V3H3_BLUHO|nr:unnamed protein product [Blumeria hordei]